MGRVSSPVERQVGGLGAWEIGRIPRGPLTSTAVVGVSNFLLRAFVLGRSKNRSATSWGMAIGALPTRELRDREVEKCRGEGSERAGTRKLGTS